MGLISNASTIFDAGSMSAGFGGSLVFIKKLTASSTATLSFVHGSGGVDFSTYKEYLFTYNNIHPADNAGENFQFNMSIDSGSNYNITKTSTLHRALHGEDGSSGGLAYYDGTDPDTLDLAQSTAFQTLLSGINDNNDDSASGILTVFDPASTTFVTHYNSQSQYSHETPRSMTFFTAGYANITSAVNAIQFKMNSGNVDAGDICMYGIA
jgi:hypothetical protein